MWGRRSLGAIAAGVLSCSGQEPCYPQNDRGVYSHYDRDTGVLSPAYRFTIDDPRKELDLGSLDRTVSAVLDCLHRTWPLMSKEDQDRGWCTGMPVLEARACLVVQVPPDWRVSSCSSKQVFPCSVPDASCRAKGQEPTPECPCSCRAIIQGQDTVVTAPDLELFPARLTELLTGCDQIWSTPLAACGSPGLVSPPEPVRQPLVRLSSPGGPAPVSQQEPDVFQERLPGPVESVGPVPGTGVQAVCL